MVGLGGEGVEGCVGCFFGGGRGERKWEMSGDGRSGGGLEKS